MSADMVPVTWFDSAYAPVGTTSTPRTGALIARLTTFPVPPALPPWCPSCRMRWRQWTPCPRCGGQLVEDKRSLPAWSPIIFRDGQRSERCATYVSALVLDFDGTAAWQDIGARWSPWRHVLHTTWSCPPTGLPRARLVLPFSRPVVAALWPRLWRWALDRDDRHDRSCGDLARLHFLPFRPPSGVARAADHAGPLLDVASLKLPDLTRPVARVAVGRRDDRLKSDPDVRRAHLVAAGGRVIGDGERERVVDVPCPACGRPSCWAWVRPRSWAGLGCEHKATCGWTGWPDQVTPT